MNALASRHDMDGLSRLTSELLGQAGAYECLAELERRPFALTRADIVSVLEQRAGESADELLVDLNDAGIITRVGQEYGLSTLGVRAFLFLQAINGADLPEVLRRLRQFDPSLRQYDLLTEGMTGHFLKSLHARPDFRRVYICSPWINLRKKAFRRLMQALFEADRKSSRPAEILVITRPVEGDDARRVPLRETLSRLAGLGADIVLHRRLHVKLYIREPGRKAGLAMAILGSENLTTQKWIELGIRITNDTEMIGNLIRYYFELYQQCEPFEEARQ